MDIAPSPALAALLASTRDRPPAAVALDAARQRPAANATPKPSALAGGPIPMSMPAILQHPKNKHLLGAIGKKQRAAMADENATSSKSKPAHAPGGKRKRRRWENAQLAGNPHLHRPSRADFAPGPSLKDLSTVFAPPPTAFSRSTYSTPASSSLNDSSRADSVSGQFSMSLRGLRRTLRSSVVGNKVTRGQGGRIEEVLEIMERELQAWLQFEGRVSPGFYHDGSLSAAKILDSTPLDDLPFEPAHEALPDEPSSSSRPPPTPPPTLVELTRLPHTLVWLAPAPQHRFLLHSLARYYRLQSFSRPLSPLDPSTRVTHILRPQLARPNPTVLLDRVNGFETPSATDWSSAVSSTEVSSISASESEAEFTETEAEFTTDDDDGDGDETGTGDEADPERGRTLAELSSDEDGDSEYGADREGFSTDDEVDRYHAQIDSLTSSLSNLDGIGSAVPSTPTATATPTRTASAPFLPYTPVSIPSSLSIATTPRPTTRARGRRSLPLGTASGRDSLESSPSRSPTRAALETESDVPAGTGTSSASGEWTMPRRNFVDWVFE
ncbi:uncharacterized protein JCM15063_002785 [Sporobolomyces koalae]|uniref:uncharacterized protein n=1 Tax=Sporobolomyces koalae TaxID=500713 RepID=UPI003177545C